MDSTLKKCDGMGGEVPEASPMDDNTDLPQVTDDEFERFVIRSPVPVIVDFYADWCRPCRLVDPILSRLSTDLNGKVRFAKVNVDESEEAAESFAVHAIPTVLFVDKGTEKGRLVGILAETEFRAMLKTCFGVP